MARQDIIVIGASAGGVEAISTVVAQLPRDLRAAVCIVLHVGPGRSVLPEILTRAGRLPAYHPADGDVLQYGRIYVAPPDHHMVLEGSRVRLSRGPTENGVRPAVDTLFRSAARAFGSRVIAVVLTGALDDGMAGMAAVKKAGGVTLVQDPEEAFAASMPRSAMVIGPDHVLPLKEMGVLLTTLVKERADVPAAAEGAVEGLEPERVPQPIANREDDRPGELSVFACPDCHGALWELEEGGVLRFRCRIGHIYSADSMLAKHTDSVDRALWAAVRSLEERAALTRKLADRARERRHVAVAQAFDARALSAAEHAAVVREIITSRTLAQLDAHEAEPDVDPMARARERVQS